MIFSRSYCLWTKYSPNKYAEILQIVNTKTKQELCRYKLSQSRASKIEQWKAKHGKFQNINQLTDLHGFGEKILDRFFDSVVHNKLSEKITSNKRANSLTIPIFVDDKIKSCVGIHFGVSNVTWARLELIPNRPCNLTHWTHYDIIKKKLHLHDLINESLHLEKLIPEADCYVVENPLTASTTTPNNAEKININVQKSQITALICFSLLKRKDKNDINCTNNVFYLKKYLSARTFKTFVGHERVSSEQAVLNIMHRTNKNVENYSSNSHDNITFTEADTLFPENLKVMYNDSEGYQKEFLGQSLLIGLTFLRLCVLNTQNKLGKVVEENS